MERKQKQWNWPAVGILCVLLCTLLGFAFDGTHLLGVILAILIAAPLTISLRQMTCLRLQKIFAEHASLLALISCGAVITFLISYAVIGYGVWAPITKAFGPGGQGGDVTNALNRVSQSRVRANR